MTMVHRYEVFTGRGGLERAADGNLVAYADYATLEAENTRLRALIDAAPHGIDCASFYTEHEYGGELKEGDLPCDCWKAGLPCDCWKAGL